MLEMDSLNLDVINNSMEQHPLTPQMKDIISVEDINGSNGPPPFALLIRALNLDDTGANDEIKAAALVALRGQISREKFLSEPARFSAAAEGSEIELLELVIAQKGLRDLLPLACFIAVANLDDRDQTPNRRHRGSEVENDTSPEKLLGYISNSKKVMWACCSRLESLKLYEVERDASCTAKTKCLAASHWGRISMPAWNMAQPFCRDNVFPLRAHFCEVCLPLVDDIAVRARVELLDALTEVFVESSQLNWSNSDF